MKSVTSKGKQSTRDTILYTLKATPDAKVEDLAEAAGISPVTVRHHINGLLADGLIEVQSVRRKVGRPYYIYNLSEGGHELFPKKYFSLTSRLLDEIKEQLPPDVINDLFSGVVKKIVDEQQELFEPLRFEEKLNYLVQVLADEGFLAKWEKTEDGYRLLEYSCPYLSMGHRHAEVCSLDKELIISVLNVQVDQHSCMLNGDDQCEFNVSRIQANAIQVN